MELLSDRQEVLTVPGLSKRDMQKDVVKEVYADQVAFSLIIKYVLSKKKNIFLSV